jgi:NlpC/P60 family putative phage cell wall peptidase
MNAIVAEARRWIDTPFAHQGALRGVGCDCIGLVIGVAASCGIKEAEAVRRDRRYQGYGPTPNGDDLRSGCRDYADEIKVNEAREGDVLLFTFLREPMHVGIVSRADPLYVIHAYQPVGCVRENRIDQKWGRRILAAYRFRSGA